MSTKIVSTLGKHMYYNTSLECSCIRHHISGHAFTKPSTKNMAGKLFYRRMSSQQIPRSKPLAVNKTRRTFEAIFLGAFPLACFGLAYWQYVRREWKLGLIKEIADKKCTSSIPLMEALETLPPEEQPYTYVEMQGEFDHSREVQIGFRPNVQKQFTPKGEKHTNGVYIVTAFKLKDSDSTILVNRGWVPASKIKPETRQKGQVTGNVHIKGVLRNSESRIRFVTAQKQKLFGLRDVERIASYLGTDPIFVDSSLDSSVEGGPIGGQTNVDIPNKHTEYLFTWIGLGIVSAALWYGRFKKNRTIPKSEKKYLKW